MSITVKLAAEVRAKAGKGASRAIRREGRVPAVIYGAGEAATTIHIEEKLLVRQLHTGHFMSAVVELELDGTTIRTLPRDVAFHPVSDRPIHVDFLRLSGSELVTVTVPVHFVGQDESSAIKAGAMLNIVAHELKLDCPSDNILDEVTVNVAGLAIGASIHIADVVLPAGVKPHGRDTGLTIATIVAPKAMRSEEATPA
ncbi:50S ribosomal protein L25/general stress protein Ctc [Sandarakinorhabdus sp.]|jgi:large subunit ribosomal protein L25|uniref:50S ribosomal protein L25/general stress protein Ctc n=1 Tax=Sandarakinorhabdus sp. TaxID=1916663 RepID=UPI0033411431